MTPPDSGECIGSVGICDLVDENAEARGVWSRAHADRVAREKECMTTTSEVRMSAESFQRVCAACGTLQVDGKESIRAEKDGTVCLPHSLAQRILAALEQEADLDAPFLTAQELEALAAELRAIVERKT